MKESFSKQNDLLIKLKENGKVKNNYMNECIYTKSILKNRKMIQSEKNINSKTNNFSIKEKIVDIPNLTNFKTKQNFDNGFFITSNTSSSLEKNNLREKYFKSFKFNNKELKIINYGHKSELPDKNSTLKSRLKINSKSIKKNDDKKTVFMIQNDWIKNMEKFVNLFHKNLIDHSRFSVFNISKSDFMNKFIYSKDSNFFIDSLGSGSESNRYNNFLNNSTYKNNIEKTIEDTINGLNTENRIFTKLNQSFIDEQKSLLNIKLKEKRILFMPKEEIKENSMINEVYNNEFKTRNNICKPIRFKNIKSMKNNSYK